jgi:hypothetical protein
MRTKPAPAGPALRASLTSPRKEISTMGTNQKWIVRNIDTKEIVNPGDAVTNFRGESGVFKCMSREPLPGKSGKVIVNGREYYDRVWDLEIIPADGHEYYDRVWD